MRDDRAMTLHVHVLLLRVILVQRVPVDITRREGSHTAHRHRGLAAAAGAGAGGRHLPQAGHVRASFGRHVVLGVEEVILVIIRG